MSGSRSSDETHDSEGRRFLGVVLKREFGWLQLAAIPTLSMATIMAGVYLNAQLSFMLEDKRMYNQPMDQIG